MKFLGLRVVTLLALFVLIGCSAADDGERTSYSTNNANNSGGNVNIGGVQDIGLFRDIIESGGIPASSTLNPNGFFSEHYIEYPFGPCDQRLCLNGMIGRGRSIISNDYMNTLQVVLKSSVDPAEYERPPTDFIAVIDVSGSMALEDKLQYVKQGLHLMVDSLNPDDRLSIVAYSGWATEVYTLTFADSLAAKDAMHESISALVPSGSTNIYGALNLAFDIADQSAAQERYARVVFLSDGVPTEGITDEASILALARESVSQTVQLTSIGVGFDLNFELMKELAMAGGNFYFIEDNAALTDIFTQEINYFAFPIAEDIQLTLSSGASFYAGDAVGFDQWESTPSGGSAFIPSIYAASRTSTATEDPHARRGGGSALFVRLVAQDVARDLSGMVLTLQYTDPDLETTSVQDISVDSLAGGDGVVPVDSYYSEEVMMKSFLMLNLYLALKEVCQRAENRLYTTARELLEAAISQAQSINMVLEDEDIGEDINLMDKFLLNLGGSTQGSCEYEGCYEDDYYYQDETVDYGCSSAGTEPTSVSLMLFSFIAGFMIIRRRAR